jgi:hypothetical protein
VVKDGSGGEEEGSGRRRWESQVGSYMVSVGGLERESNVLRGGKGGSLG